MEHRLKVEDLLNLKPGPPERHFKTMGKIQLFTVSDFLRVLEGIQIF